MPWRGPEVEGEFPTLGFLAADWIESTLRFTDGPKEGQPVQLYDEQVNHFLHRYRLDPKARQNDGNDAFLRRGSMLVRGQKWGKDPLLAMDDLFHAFGPCDFAGWDANGEPVGAPHPSPWVFVAALNDRQTDNTWLPLKAMVETSELVDIPGVEVNLDMIRLPGGNPIEPLTTTAYGRLGGRFTAGSLTENGLMTDTAVDRAGGGKRSPLVFARTLIRSVVGMNGMWIAATNTWDPTEESHAQRMYDSKPKRVYIDAKVSRKRVDIDDDEALRDELLYLYGDAAKENGGHVSVRSLMEDCRDTETHGESEIRRFFLSEIVAGERDAVDPERWAALTRTDDPLQPGERISLGFDGSRSRDATALTACRIRDGRLFHLRTWVPSEHEGYKVPRDQVDQAVRDAFDSYEVWYLFGDPYRWQDYLDVWAGDFENRVVEFPTNVETRMDKAISRFLDAYKDGSLTHDGHATLTQHAKDAGLKKGKKKPPREGDDGLKIEHYLQVTKKRDGALIDVFVAAILAYEARGQAIEDGALVDDDPEPFFLMGG